jgi:hypothetical protein
VSRLQWLDAASSNLIPHWLLLTEYLPDRPHYGLELSAQTAALQERMHVFLFRRLSQT